MESMKKARNIRFVPGLAVLCRVLVLSLVALIAVPGQALAECDPLVVKYDGSNWWWGALGKCIRPGGPTGRDAIFNCAWAQVPASDRLACLRGRLRQTEQTRQGIDKVAAANGPSNRCNQLMVKYDGSNWWWGAFGNCKRAGGPTARNAIFSCAWSQVPASDKMACLQTRLQQTEQTRRGIDNVAAANGPVNNCDQLMVKYDGSSWWSGAFGNCRRRGGPTDRAAVFDCAWSQVPVSERKACLRARLQQTEQTRRGVDAVLAFNSVIPSNSSTVSFSRPEGCDLPTNGTVPPQYFAPLMPQNLVDTPVGSFNVPPAHNIGANEGRLRSDLRAVARLADPLGCSLHLSSMHFALGDASLGRAHADLSVTGRRAFAAFRRALPGSTYCESLATRTLPASCPAPARRPNKPDLVAGCGRALDRAYAVANFLRTGQARRTNPGKIAERNSLGWIAVSGEDDSPHRPVNVPSSDFPQYDLEVDVPAPRANPPLVRVSTRYVIAQSKPPALATVGPAGWTLRSERPPAIGPNADILIFVHGMDSRAEEATDIANELIRRKANSSRNLVVISVDLPSAGYADNLDFNRISPLSAIGAPKTTTVPVPVPIPPGIYEPFAAIFVAAGLPPPPPLIPPGTPIPDFGATGQVPVLDFIEDFVVRFVETLDRQVPIKNNIRAVMGGSLGGNISFRLGRRDLSWLPAVVAWSPASIWNSLGEGADVIKHQGPREAWLKAANRDPSDPNDLSPRRSGLRRDFFGGWDRPILPGVIPAQSDTWASNGWPCKRSAIAAARLDRHETYDPRFLSWHWRLGAEQLLYSHQSADPTTGAPRFMSNHKRMLLACGTEDRVPFNEICPATQKTAPHMAMTPGKALFLEATGHSIANERKEFFARQIDEFLGLQ